MARILKDLTADDVLQVLNRLEAGETRSAVGAHLDVSPSTVGTIQRNFSGKSREEIEARLAPSDKTAVVERLYDNLTAKGQMVAIFSDVREAMQQCGSPLSDDNIANFMKDIVRSNNASTIWPKRLTALRIGGRQRVGEDRILEFIPFESWQTDPFQNSFTANTSSTPIPVQSISLPLPARSLGRKDESWLIQVAVGLKVIETHFAVRNKLPRILDIAHLQTGVKLGGSEVDCLFLAQVQDEAGRNQNALITCEAKQSNERIVESQIVQQIVATNRSIKSAGITISQIIPILIQAIKQPEGSIYLAEFEPWTPEEAEAPEDQLGQLVLSAEGVYQLHPPVLGVGFDRPKEPIKRKAARRAKAPQIIPQPEESPQSPADDVS